MKDKSHLENVSDRIIILICKEILKKTEEHDLDDREFIKVCDEVSVKLFGDTMKHIDVDYMSKILEINPDILSNDKDVKLLRPEFNLFKFDYIEKRTEWRLNTYTHEMGTYHDDIEPIVDFMSMEGEFDYWDSISRDSDILDSDIEDTYLSRKSIVKIN